MLRYYYKHQQLKYHFIMAETLQTSIHCVNTSANELLLEHKETIALLQKISLQPSSNCNEQLFHKLGIAVAIPEETQEQISH